MAIYKCSICGGDMEFADGDAVAVCPRCGNVHPVSQPEAVQPGLTAFEASDEISLSFSGQEAPEEVETEELAVLAGADPTEEPEVPAEPAPESEVSAEPAPEPEEACADVDSLLEQAVGFLAVSDWDGATQCSDRVLEVEPENAWAYVCKLLAELNIPRPENLKYLVTPFDTNDNYQKAIIYADDRLRAELIGYIDHINERNENACAESVYAQAKTVMLSAETEADFRDAAYLFESIGNYIDASDFARSCHEKADCIKNDAFLAQGDALMASTLPEDYAAALALFEQIPGWQDADEKAAFCRQQCEALAASGKAESRKAKLIRKKKAQLIKRSLIIRLSVSAALILILISVLLFFAFTPRRRYNNAIELKETGKYDDAIAAFEALTGYRDSRDQITDCKYLYAVGMMNSQQYEKAITVFEELEDYKDSKEKIPACQEGIRERDYTQGIAQLKKGNIVEAYELLAPLGDYKDSAERASSIFERYKIKKMQNPEVGSSLFLGRYHQDTDKDNGMEDIEWIILKIEDGKALVVSKYALEASLMHTENVAVTWENCALRGWLNEEFFNTAFDQSEKELIPTVTVPAHAVPDSKTDPGNDTEDRIFLLSYEEVTTYFPSDAQRQCKASAYAAENGAYVRGTEETSWWWLRTPGFYAKSFMCVSSNGAVNDFGLGVTREKGTLRPAMWIILE